MQKVQVKICGIKTMDALDAAIGGGASYIGLNFYRPSPRSVTPEQAAQLAKQAEGRVKRVALVVDPTEELLNEIFARFTPDMLQLHGKETPKRVAEIKAARNVPVIKALPISEAADFEATKAYEPVVDYLMFDGKAPEGAMLPGGNAISFDWKLLSGRSFARPWFLAGGLNARNIKEAVDLSNATRVDIASGVETSPGVKDPALIRQLLGLFS